MSGDQLKVGDFVILLHADNWIDPKLRMLAHKKIQARVDSVLGEKVPDRVRISWPASGRRKALSKIFPFDCVQKVVP